jgi:DNA polymerase-3 subunit epsilon
VNWLSDLLGRKPEIVPAHAALTSAYDALPPTDPHADIRALRFVVVDVETTGLDPHRDRLLSIGAVAVEAMLIRIESSFAALLRQEGASTNENILVHGIDGTTQITAPSPADALAQFVRFAGKAPLVAFHVPFDRTMIDRALRGHLSFRLDNAWLDLAHLAPALLPEHGSARTLDDWTGLCGIENYRRHDALADALATAQLLQVVLARACARGTTSLSDLVDEAKAQEWLGRR